MATAIPAPISLRPFADLYNPFPYGCSLLCNHPTDREARDILRRARETWAQESKNIIHPEEIQAIRESLAHVEEIHPNYENIPEDLFRRYTETDSRPLTPAPTLASVKTKGSGSRRCVTPDPVTSASVLQERKLLILDLRRSHSQEVISWHGMNDPPLIGILQAPTPSISVESPSDLTSNPSRRDTPKPKNIMSPSPKNSPKVQKLEVPKIMDNQVYYFIIYFLFNVVNRVIKCVLATDGSFKSNGRA